MSGRRILQSFIWVIWASWCVGCAQVDANEPIPYRAVAAEPGERCVICGVSLGKDDVALIVKGRRVPLTKAMVGKFLKNPERYFNSKLVRGAFFQEEFHAPEGVVQAGVSMGWFLLGVYILAALIFAALCGYAAITRGLPAVPAFFLGLCLNAFGLLYVLTRPSRVPAGKVPRGLHKVPATPSPLACPACGRPNHPSASRCSSCNQTLYPRLKSEVARVSSSPR